jgi:uncharacterized membrane protein
VLYTLMIFASIGVLFVLLGLPLALRRIGPNWWYGVRVPETLNDVRLWYAANAYCGKHLAVAGTIIAVVAAAVYLIPGVNGVWYTLLCAATTLCASFSLVGGCALVVRRGVRS